jgi:hypothetical protein
VKIVAKVTRKRLDKSRLKDVPQDKVFWCHDGRVMKNLNELVVALREMSKETFRYHVTMDKNDFSNWVREVIGDEILAEDLQKATTPTAAAEKVEKRLYWLRSKL